MDKKMYLRRFDTDPARKLLFTKVLDRFFLCAEQGVNSYTDFLDPFNRAAFQDALEMSAEIGIRSFGGSADCERQMLGFSVDHESLTDDTFPVKRLRVTYNEKFNKAPRHQDVLGAVLALGIDRGRIGDIFLLDGCVDLFVNNAIAGYICEQLIQAGRTHVKVACVERSDGMESHTFTEKSLTVASLRLDVVIAAAFHLSRTQAATLIASEKAFINWNPVSDAGRQLREGDSITARGLGRVQLLQIGGKTKKDRLRITVSFPSAALK